MSNAFDIAFPKWRPTIAWILCGNTQSTQGSASRVSDMCVVCVCVFQAHTKCNLFMSKTILLLLQFFPFYFLYLPSFALLTSSFSFFSVFLISLFVSLCLARRQWQWCWNYINSIIRRSHTCHAIHSIPDVSHFFTFDIPYRHRRATVNGWTLLLRRQMWYVRSTHRSLRYKFVSSFGSLLEHRMTNNCITYWNWRWREILYNEMDWRYTTLNVAWCHVDGAINSSRFIPSVNCVSVCISRFVWCNFQNKWTNFPLLPQRTIAIWFYFSSRRRNVSGYWGEHLWLRYDVRVDVASDAEAETENYALYIVYNDEANHCGSVRLAVIHVELVNGFPESAFADVKPPGAFASKRWYAQIDKSNTFPELISLHQLPFARPHVPPALLHIISSSMHSQAVHRYVIWHSQLNSTRNRSVCE